MSEKKQPPSNPPIFVKFNGLFNDIWITSVNEYGLSEITCNDEVIANIMPVLGDTHNRKFQRIYAEIIALSGYLISMPEVQNDECVISTLETINTILNEQL
jgi:hypothetical protein